MMVVIQFMYGVAFIGLPLFMGWASSTIWAMQKDMDKLMHYSKMDHQVFTNELSAAHKRINQLEVIVFSHKK